MQYELKILPKYFKAVKEGTKTFEIRKNDRGFKVGDTLLLKEYEQDYTIGNSFQGYTGQEITKEITYILEGGQYGLEEGYCIASLKSNGIILRNIDLTGIDVNEQHLKTIEEMNELFDAIEIGTKENVIDEYLDVMQSWLGYIFKRRDIKAEEVQEYYSTWVKKLENRPRQKKCNKCAKYVENPNNENIFICLKDSSELKIDLDIAKECKSYEESEE